jgi:hypothetical protein
MKRSLCCAVRGDTLDSTGGPPHFCLQLLWVKLQQAVDACGTLWHISVLEQHMHMQLLVVNLTNASKIRLFVVRPVLRIRGCQPHWRRRLHAVSRSRCGPVTVCLLQHVPTL